MASVARFGKFKADKAGYADLMASAPVQAVLRKKAAKVKKAADAALSEGGYDMEGHELKEFEGILAPGYVVRTKTDQARYTQAKRKSLSKALGAAKGE